MSNQQVQPANTSPIQFLQQDNVKRKFEELLGKRASSFLTSVLQIVSNNSYLKNSSPQSIYNAACVAATLDLPINNNLGFAYIVPYGKDAQFQMGYRGFIQLAQRSGQFKTISATPIYQGQIVAENPLTGYEFDFTVSKTGSPIGYAAYFKLLNGFEKTLYMTTEELKQHGLRFSQTFKRGQGLWKDDFESMALKTVIKLLLSKFAPLSVEMQQAVITDQGVIDNPDTLEVAYTDNTEPEINHELERAEKMVVATTSIEKLEALLLELPEDIKVELQPVIENHRIFIVKANEQA
jgi:recombination protein RecT